jgi:hypothetical protein
MAISISFFCSVATLCALGIWRLEQLLLVERSGTIVGDHEADAYAFQLGQESKTMTRVALVVGAVLAVVGAVYGWRTGIYEHVFPPAPPVVAASLSIDCDQVQFPLTVQPNTSTCGLVLEKGKASYLCTDKAKTTADQWPRALRESRLGFQCRLTNTGRAPMISVSMWIPIRYQSPRAKVKAREELLSLSQSLEPDAPFDLYFFDDSGLDPIVTLPGTVSVRLQGEIESKPVKVDYSGGEPAKLNGFGPASSSTAN